MLNFDLEKGLEKCLRPDNTPLNPTTTDQKSEKSGFYLSNALLV